MPTKRLPPDANLDHLKHQAKDLLKAHRALDIAANQRIREFHPRFASATDRLISEADFTLGDAQFAIAREYGFLSWSRLKAYVEKLSATDLDLPLHERIDDPAFRQAVDLLDAGDVNGLSAHLSANPGIARRRVVFEGGNYFKNPSLLEFVAGNPSRRERLPKNIAQVAKIILDAGGRDDASSLNSALALTSSSRTAFKCGVQDQLIDLLCDYGADPNCGMLPALMHGDFGAAEDLIRRGARIDLEVAAATGRTDNGRTLLPQANDEERQRALALAAQHGRIEVVRLLLEAGEDPNRFTPVGGHSHSTPLHQAANAGHQDVVRLLVQHGARLDMKDIVFGGTPLDWARYAGHSEIAEYLSARTRERFPRDAELVENSRDTVKCRRKR